MWPISLYYHKEGMHYPLYEGNCQSPQQDDVEDFAKNNNTYIRKSNRGRRWSGGVLQEILHLGLAVDLFRVLAFSRGRLVLTLLQWYSESF